jgi:antitoxin ParD1/3/4
LEERDALRQTRLDDIRQAIQDGNAQLARGEGLPGEQVFADIRAKSRARRHDAP